MSNFLILPHQLFDSKYLNKKNKIIIWEHPNYFTKYNFNKKKLILHRASMKYYEDYLKKKKFKVEYVEFDEPFNYKNLEFFDPIDKLKIKGKMIESPNFILTKKDHELYRKKTTKFMFNNFYIWSKNLKNIHPELRSMDKMNRQVFKGNEKIPKLPNNKSDKKFIDEAIKYVETNFPNNYGNTDNFIYPISHKNAKKWLKDFIKKRFENFGPYQDFVKKDNIFMFHSILSSSINIGLLNPLEIIKEINKVKGKVAANSFEGYLRQLFWREYQRLTYNYIDFFKHDYFGNKKKLNKKWYNGTLGIPPIDDLIKTGFDTGYMHHIGRLMYMGNFMNIYGLSPKEGFKWFMEFSVDSYEWVMCQNVLDMVFFCTGGMTMRKPYVSKTNYILKNSEYKKGPWCDKWNNLYDNFLRKNKDKLWKFRYNFPTLKKL